MTREEEILQIAKNNYPYIKELPQTSSHRAIFIEGAKWADKSMIEKACEWLKENRDELSHVDTSGFVKIFKKAMEE